MWHPVIKICFYPPLKFFSVVVYLSYKSTTAYSWLGYTYLIARNLSSWCWSRHQSSSWPGRIKNREIEWKAEGDSHLCFFYLWFFFLSLSWRPSSQFPDDQSCSSTVNSTAPSAWQFPDHDAHRTTVNAENLLVTILSSVPPISTPLHARQELNLELYFLLVMFFLGCFWIDQFSVDGTGTWQGSLEKAKTRTGAHIHDE